MIPSDPRVFVAYDGWVSLGGGLLEVSPSQESTVVVEGAGLGDKGVTDIQDIVTTVFFDGRGAVIVHLLW